MIATHNIKVNGRWIAAGESYGEPVQEKLPIPEAKAPEEVPEKTQEAAPEEKREPRKTTTRRKTGK